MEHISSVYRDKNGTISFLADKTLYLHLLITIETIIVLTKEENVVSNRATDTGFVSPCNHEEYDTCMFLHAKPATLCSNNSL